MVSEFFQHLLPFFLLLGTLIVLHEAGHFLAARYFGVKVEVFSVGFGPKIFQFKKGDTVYCLSLIPLGGYVKLFGDNPRQSIPKELQKESFFHQKFWPKSAIALAGPVMNLLVAVIVFMAIGMIGTSKIKPYVGDLENQSMAYQKGFRSGDQILSVNQKKIHYWSDVQKWIDQNPETSLSFLVKRDQSKVSISIEPTKEKNTQLTRLSRFFGDIKGLTPASQSAHVGVYDTSSLAYQKGIRTFDEIVSINQKRIYHWRDLEKYFSVFIQKSKNLKIQLKRQDQPVTISFETRHLTTLKQLGVEKTSLYIDRVKPNSPADQAGLKRGDRLFLIGKKKLFQWQNLSDWIKEEKSPIVQLTIVRNGIKKEISIQPEQMPTVQLSGEIDYRPMIGIASAYYTSYPEIVHFRLLNPLKALHYGINMTLKWVGVTGKVLWKLVTGSISHRMLGGPLSIAKAAKRSFSDSLVEFLSVMAIISVNLFLMNLLPIPVLDGGRLLIFVIEKIKGSALSVAKIEMIQLIGFFMILFFIALTFVNDIRNWNIIW